MSYDIQFGDTYSKQYQKLKRNRGFSETIKAAIRLLLKEPQTGKVMPKGKGIRKLRVPNSGNSIGSSYGYRILYKIVESPRPTLWFLGVYDKRKKSDVTSKELLQLVEEFDSLRST